MTRRDPVSAAPCTAFSPTPPVPITTTSMPGGSAAVLTTAPKPVITPQASSEATSKPMSSAIFTICDWSVTTSSANAAVFRPCTSLPPPGRLSGLCASSGNRVSHEPRMLRAQHGQVPQLRTSVITTRSPGAKSVTPSPTPVTTPAASCPKTAGSVPPQPPSA